MKANRDDVIRQFWSEFLSLPVEKDGQIKGLRRIRNEMPQEHQRGADRYAESCWMKIERDGREPVECVASGVEALRRELRSNPDPEPERRGEDGYTRFRNDLIQRIREEHLTPLAVAQTLESAADVFPQVELAECRRLREMGEHWQPIYGNPIETPTWWERQQAIVASMEKRPLKAILEILRSQGKPPDESWPGWKKAGFREMPPPSLLPEGFVP